MDTQQRRRKITTGIVGGTWMQTSMRDQQQSANKKIPRSRTLYHGTSIDDTTAYVFFNYCICSF